MKHRTSLLPTALAASALLALTANAQAATVARNCKPPPTGVAFRASDTIFVDGATDFTTYKNLPETVVNFTQGGSGPGCVIVFFSANVYRGTSEDVFIRAVIDGNVVGLPQDQQWDSSTVSYRANGGSFIFPSVAPGAHSLRMQLRTHSGTGVGVRERNTILYYVR
jgi:hypothetical protein